MTPAPRRPELLALAAILALAAALRIVGSGYGLPYPLLNPDEASIVPRAWRIAHGAGLDPGWYDYPSLLMYLVAPAQALFDGPSYGAASGIAVTIGLLGVAAAWWLGRRAYGPGAGLIAAAAVAVATVHVAYSRMAVTDVALTLGITVALALGSPASSSGPAWRQGLRPPRNTRAWSSPYRCSSEGGASGDVFSPPPASPRWPSR